MPRNIPDKAGPSRKGAKRPHSNGDKTGKNRSRESQSEKGHMGAKRPKPSKQPTGYEESLKAEPIAPSPQSQRELEKCLNERRKWFKNKSNSELKTEILRLDQANRTSTAAQEEIRHFWKAEFKRLVEQLHETNGKLTASVRQRDKMSSLSQDQLSAIVSVAVAALCECENLGDFTDSKDAVDLLFSRVKFRSIFANREARLKKKIIIEYEKVKKR